MDADLMLDGRQLFGNFLLFGFKQIQRDSVAIVGFKQFLSLVLKFSFLAFQTVQLFFVFFFFALYQRGHLFFQHYPHFYR
ncbi:hypothetical protein LKD70_13135 [Ruminococcus sp. CLA-AA-H200]|uniref:Uncharacterized protein n=1 Tax=Ruminococcus turbiniformis TaxID=2881258 RepID=A0ABS8G0D9_9FIRM|nr:hypothetical protein [Ruminococcus turbiniformis]MCC2255349.1 hypothetical protein [Ruminococcus turbiniformis]